MELKSIKLSGFKSFADATTVPLTGRLTAIVGPNGCGKSNVIDAVRCVLSGAARQLRGDTMTDVIFNGAAKRKPVGQAVVELIFDNTSGRVGGEYANYNEISVRREIQRDGQSYYSLNGVRCRRRDVVDIFLGTGLGAESYAIIEQGKITRLIESKPQELRGCLEEVAGISKYKERRHETELRIGHTRENLARLTDHRTELEKQLNHLKRQAQAAERYQELRQNERQLKAQLQALHWRALQEKIEQRTHEIATQETELAAVAANQQQQATAVIQLREQYNNANEEVQKTQAHFYSLGAEIARWEEQLQSKQQQKNSLQQEYAELAQKVAQLTEQSEQDQFTAEELTTSLTHLEPQCATAKEHVAHTQTTLAAAEHAVQDWQKEWEVFNQQFAAVQREIEVQQARLQHFVQTIHVNEQRQQRLQNEQQEFVANHSNQAMSELQQQLASSDEALNALQQNLNDNQQKIQQAQQAVAQQTDELNQARQQLQHWYGQRTALAALQQAALGKNNQTSKQWLQQQGLAESLRFGETLEVAAGWELAVETILYDYLEAVCIADFDIVTSALLNQMPEAISFLVTQPEAAKNVEQNNSSPLISLASKISSAATTLPLALADIFIAENLAEALSVLAQLSATQSVITRDGIWIGKNWLRIGKRQTDKTGVVQRERELKELQQRIAAQEQQIQNQEEAQQNLMAALSATENDRQQLQQHNRELTLERQQQQEQWHIQHARFEQWQQRAAQIARELAECQQQITTAQTQQSASQETFEQAQINNAALLTQKAELLEQREALHLTLENQRQLARVAQVAVEELQTKLATTRNELHFLQQTLVRAEKQLTDLQARQKKIQEALQVISEPEMELQEKLTVALEQRLACEQQLAGERQQLNQLQYNMQQREQAERELQQLLQAAQQQLADYRLTHQSLTLQQQGHAERIVELNFALEILLNELAADAALTEWEKDLQQVMHKIERLGAINLAAIDEYQQLSERKSYLDAQNDDLVEALNTLEAAIKKIDHESRDRLQEVFDQINRHFNELFARIFQGGQAHLELTETDDLLTAGIIIKAQPPGKRNASIHLLSGGEKVLTAVALVFSFFQLNPAPFCILDEVDAPLDDLNIERFCNLLKEMSQKIQFLFISHNKLSIAAAEQLIGVTMQEPGVSRLVAVDIEEALAFATA